MGSASFLMFCSSWPLGNQKPCPSSPSLLPFFFSSLFSSHNHGKVEVGMDLRKSSCQPPCSNRATLSRLPRAMSSWVLSISKEGDFTASQGSLLLPSLHAQPLALLASVSRCQRAPANAPGASRPSLQHPARRKPW